MRSAERWRKAFRGFRRFLEKDVELRRKVKSAMTYPMMIMCFALMVMIGLMTFILPKFMSLFTDLGIKELPAMTADTQGHQRLHDRQVVLDDHLRGGLRHVSQAVRANQGRAGAFLTG